MAAPERNYRTPENEEELLAELEHINTDENPVERAWKLERFYEEIEALNAPDIEDQDTHEGGSLSTLRT